MKEHDFTLILTTEPDENAADKLYSICEDSTISTLGGVPQIHFLRPANSLEEAIRSAIREVRSLEFDVARVELEPDTVVQSA